MLNLQRNLNTVLSAIKDRFQTAHAKNHEKADSVKLRTFEVGSSVLWKTPGLSKALSTSWEGPYK